MVYSATKPAFTYANVLNLVRAAHFRAIFTNKKEAILMSRIDRLPAIPLIASDPYLSIWMPASSRPPFRMTWMY